MRLDRYRCTHRELRLAAALRVLDDVPTTAGCDGDPNELTSLDQAAAAQARHVLTAKHLDDDDLSWSRSLICHGCGLTPRPRN